MAEQRRLTYADIVNGDILIDDKRGDRWAVSAVTQWQVSDLPAKTRFTITRTDGKVFPDLVRVSSEHVTIERQSWMPVVDHPTVEAFREAVRGPDPWETTKADHPFQPGFSGVTCEHMVMRDGGGDQCGLSAAYHSDDLLDAAVEAAKALPAEVAVETSTEEVRQADAATEVSPARVSAFADLDIMAKRSHLYVLHGIHAKDVKTTPELVAMHEQADADRIAGKLLADYKPHVHEGEK